MKKELRNKLFELEERETRGLFVPLFKYIQVVRLAEQLSENEIAQGLRVRESWLREFRRDDPELSSKRDQTSESLTIIY
jgi:hypothetical protein